MEMQRAGILPFEAGIDYHFKTEHSSTHTNTGYILMLDEMKIKQGLVYNHDNAKLFGNVRMRDSKSWMVQWL